MKKIKKAIVVASVYNGRRIPPEHREVKRLMRHNSEQLDFLMRLAYRAYYSNPDMYPFQLIGGHK